MVATTMPHTNEILIILGPTASGKSALAIEAAKMLGGEIVSADSRQVYRGLDIGSGKVTREEMNGVPHHLLDVADPRDTFSVAQFCDTARDTIANIHARGKLPILCGGSAFWIYALVDEWKIPEVSPNPALRSELAQKSANELFEQLSDLDPERAATIDRHNPARLIRAIEIASEIGKVPPRANSSARYTPTFIGIDIPREKLRENIHARLLARIDAGMIDEVKNLHANGLSWERLESLGLEYRFIARFLQNKISREQMIVDLDKAIISFSKRQMTWWKHDGRIRWFTPSDAVRFLTETYRRPQ